jgi:hypothetical protein
MADHMLSEHLIGCVGMRIEILAIAAVLHDREGVAGILEDDPEGAAKARRHLVSPADEIIRSPAHKDADAVTIGGDPQRLWFFA